MKLQPHSKQQGVTTVEFALGGTVYFMVLFAVIEVGRFMFTLNVLDEVTRRGARLAAVCPVTENNEVINTAIMNGSVISNLLPEHVEIRYLSPDFTPIADPVASFSDIGYVRVRIQGYTHRLLIPFLVRDINPPTFSTTVLAESLGVSPPGTGTTAC